MYSLVLMAALSGGPDATAFGKRAGCHGCTGCSGPVVASCQGCYASSCHGCYASSCHGCYASSCYGTYAPMAYATACYGSCYGTSYQTGCWGSCHGSCLGSSCYGWSVGGSSCFGGCSGCYGLGNPVGGGYGYHIWIDPNNGPTIMPPRVGYLMHGGSFYGRLWHPYSGHTATYHGGGYYDDCHGLTIPQYAGGNETGYLTYYGAGGYDPTVIEDVYAARPAAAPNGPGGPGAPATPAGPKMDAPRPKQVSAPGRADVAVELPADAVLTVDGQAVAGTGGSRRFHTPELAAGKAYYYEMTATVTVDGRPVTETATAVVRAGEATTVTFGRLLAAVKTAGTAVAAK